METQWTWTLGVWYAMCFDELIEQAVLNREKSKSWMRSLKAGCNAATARPLELASTVNLDTRPLQAE